jgi:LysM repeat protein
MDTISRENNTSYLPIAGVIAALIALVLSAVALVKVSSVSRTLSDKIDADGARLDTIESTANSAEADAQKAKSDIAVLHNSTQDGFNQVGSSLGTIQASITKLEEAAKAPPRAARASKSAGGSAPGTVSADGTYTVKGGDSLAKIARANGVSLADLEAANPGVDPKHLKIGQKISLPEKK